MIDREHFDLIKRKHGAYGSWAVWAPPSGRPKSNMGNLDVFDERTNPGLLETLNPGVVMVGLNISREFSNELFRNFHDPRPMANDFKIRFAFRDSPFWGAYMTDVIKQFKEPASARVATHLSKHPEFMRDHVATLREELLDLGQPKPLILAFGGKAYSLLEEHLSRDDYSVLIQLTHYSHRMSKEKYRDEVHQQIGRAGLP